MERWTTCVHFLPSSKIIINPFYPIFIASIISLKKNTTHSADRNHLFLKNIFNCLTTAASHQGVINIIRLQFLGVVFSIYSLWFILCLLLLSFVKFQPNVLSCHTSLSFFNSLHIHVLLSVNCQIPDSPVSEPTSFEEDVAAGNCLYLTRLCTPVREREEETKRKEFHDRKSSNTQFDSFV